MELEFVFRGIELANDGTYPRAIVEVTQPEHTLAEGLALAKVRITLPLRDISRPTDAVGLDAVQTARQLLHAPALRAWLAAQETPPAE